MDVVENLIKDIWYGDINQKDYESLSIQDEEKELLKILAQLKIGDFSKKDQLINLIINSNDKNILNLGIRVFLSVSSSEDFLKIEKYLSEADEREVRVFTAFVEDSLSYEIIPLLLGLLSIWEETEVEIIISQTIGRMIDYTKARYELCSEDELGDAFVTFCEDKDLTKYYLKGKEFFIGDLTKELIEKVMIAKNQNAQFKNNIIPSMLSINSGIKCPVSYNTVINDDKVREVFTYVKTLAQMNWEKGCKYFYGHKVI